MTLEAFSRTIYEFGVAVRLNCKRVYINIWDYNEDSFINIAILPKNGSHKSLMEYLFPYSEHIAPPNYLTAFLEHHNCTIFFKSLFFTFKYFLYNMTNPSPTGYWHGSH